jgi:hypothetical protein
MTPATGTTVPGSTGPGTTVPGSTGPGSTGPGSTGPGSTGPGTTGSAAAARGHPRFPHLTLNDDGQRHPMENALSVFTLVGGLVACVLGFLADQDVSGAWTHVGATWLGLIVLVVGLPAQLYSATRSERMLIVTGLVAAFVGVCLGLAHGGLLP